MQLTDASKQVCMWNSFIGNWHSCSCWWKVGNSTSQSNLGEKYCFESQEKISSVEKNMVLMCATSIFYVVECDR